MAETPPTPATPTKVRAIKDIKALAKYTTGENKYHSFNAVVKTSKGKPDKVDTAPSAVEITPEDLKAQPVFFARRHNALFMLDASPAEIAHIKTLTVQEIASAYRT